MTTIHDISPGSASQNRLRDNGSPFNDIDADIILRSADGIDFRVHRLILSKASECFQDMFTAQPIPPKLDNENADSDDFIDGLPVVRLEESSATLRALLTLIYPFDNPTIDDVHLLQPLIHALDKYVIEGLMRTRETIVKAFIKTHPHLVYAIACRYSMPKIADHAAEETLRSPMMLTNGPLKDSELLQMTSVQLRMLLQYHWLCVQTVKPVMRLWLPETPSTSPSSYPCVQMSNEAYDPVRCICKRQDFHNAKDHRKPFTVPMWAVRFLKDCETRLNERPHWDCVVGGPPSVDATHKALQPYLEEAGKCKWCQWRAQVELQSLRRTLIRDVRVEIEKVPLPFGTSRS